MISLVPAPIRTICFEVPAAPKPKPRARHSTRVVLGPDGRPKVNARGKPLVISKTHEDPEGKASETTFAALAAPFAPPEPHDGPVLLGLEFVLPVPASYKGWRLEAALAGALMPEGRPDFDNLEKLVMDALSRTKRWWANDSRVCGYVRPPSKRFGNPPRTIVEVQFLPRIDAAAWRALKARVAEQAPRDLFGGPTQ